MTVKCKPPDIPIDRVLYALASDHRRVVVTAMVGEAGPTTTCGELIDVLCTECADIDDPETARSQLHHKILPKLEACDVVEYDARSRTVRYQPHPFVEAVLACITDWEQ